MLTEPVTRSAPNYMSSSSASHLISLLRRRWVRIMGKGMLAAKLVFNRSKTSESLLQHISTLYSNMLHWLCCPSVSIANLYARMNEIRFMCLTPALPMILSDCRSSCEWQSNWKGKCKPREAPGRAQLNSALDKMAGLCMEALQLCSSVPDSPFGVGEQGGSSPIKHTHTHTHTLSVPPAKNHWDN